MQTTSHSSAPPPYTLSPQYSLDNTGCPSQHGNYTMNEHLAQIPYRSQPQEPPSQQWVGSNPYTPIHSTSLQPTSQTTLTQFSTHSPEIQQCHSSQVQKPCVIPQVTKVFGSAYLSPLVHARVPKLEKQFGIPVSELLAFIDGLNEAFMANPLLQATSLIGTIVGFVPLGSTQIVGGGLQLAAGLGAAGVSIARTKAYMKRANEDLLKPRSLHAQIVKTEKMLGLIGMAGDYDAFIQHQYEAMSDNARMENGNGNPIVRRMDALGDRVMELSFDSVDAPVAPENWMKKLGSYQAQRAEKKQLAKLDKRQARMERRSARSERKVNRAERKQAEVQEIMEGMAEIQVQLERLDPGQQGYKEAHGKLMQEHRELRRDLRVADTDKHSRKTDKRNRKFAKRTQRRLDRQAKKMKKILWIVITAEGGSPASDDDWASDEDSEVESVEECGEKSHEDW